MNQKYKPGIGACDAAVPKGAAALAACVAGPLTKLLAFAETTILNEAGEGPVNVSSVPVYLGATAGLRLLVPEHSTAIMGAVRSGRVQFLRTLPGVLCCGCGCRFVAVVQWCTTPQLWQVTPLLIYFRGSDD